MEAPKTWRPYCEISKICERGRACEGLKHPSVCPICIILPSAAKNHFFFGSHLDGPIIPIICGWFISPNVQSENSYLRGNHCNFDNIAIIKKIPQLQLCRTLARSWSLDAVKLCWEHSESLPHCEIEVAVLVRISAPYNSPQLLKLTLKAGRSCSCSPWGRYGGPAGWTPWMAVIH